MTFEELVIQAEPIIEQVAKKWTGLFAELEDIKQETYLVLYQKFNLIKDMEHPLGYARRTAELVCYTINNREMRQVFNSINPDSYENRNTDDIQCIKLQRYERRLQRAKDYYQENREKILEKQRQHYHDHKEEVTEYRRKYYQEHKEEINAKARKYRHKHAEKYRECARNHYYNNKERYQQRYQEHKDELQEYQRKYRQEHREEINAKARERRRIKKED